MASRAFGENSEDMKPVIPAGASDTAALDAVFEALCRAGRDAPTAKLILVPEAWGSESDVPDNHRALYTYLASVMEPRSEEHTSELQSLMRISYAVFCLKKTTNTKQQIKSGRGCEHEMN